MKHNVAKISVTLILAILAVGLIPIFPVMSIPTTIVYVDPSSISYESPPIAIGFKFNVTVWVSDVTDLCAYQVQIRYNPAVVTCFDAFEPTWDSNYVLYSILPKTATTEAAGADRYTIGGSESPGNPAAHFSGTGLITLFCFQVTNVPGKGETIDSVLNITNDQVFLLDGSGTPITIDENHNGYVSITWKQPPKPWFAVESAELNPMPYFTNVVGTEFNIKVDIKNYYAGWHMTNASFYISYDTSLINITATVKVALNLADWTGPNVITLGHGATDWVNVTVRGFVGSEDAGATVPVATITFKVVYQGVSPPMSTGGFNETALHFDSKTEIWDHSYTIHNPSVDGSVKIYALLSIPLPYFEVVPKNTVLGPEPAIGTIFEVNVKVKNLYEAWHIVAYQVRLGYDDTLLEAMEVTEGAFLTDPQWNWYGTLFASSLHMPPKPYAPQWNVAAGGILFPNATGQWNQTTFPNSFDAADRTLFTVTFKAIKQTPGITLNCILGIYPGSVGSAEYLLDKDGNWVMVDEPHNIDGNYTMKSWPSYGRRIDVYTQYPDGYNGKGLGVPSDMFWPQKEVNLTAYVTYNGWPVQHKPVTFKVYDNNGHLWAVIQDYTNSSDDPTKLTGYAHASFRIPWQCVNPEQYFGIWNVTAEVDIACEVVTDFVNFHYDYLFHYDKVTETSLTVTTDKTYYNHYEIVTVTVKYSSFAAQTYKVSIAVTIYDELNVPIATLTKEFLIGNATICSLKTYRPITFPLLIEKWAFAGIATVHAVPLMWWDDTWISAGPETTVQIIIQPY